MDKIGQSYSKLHDVEAHSPRPGLLQGITHQFHRFIGIGSPERITAQEIGRCIESMLEPSSTTRLCSPLDYVDQLLDGSPRQASVSRDGFRQTGFNDIRRVGSSNDLFEVTLGNNQQLYRNREETQLHVLLTSPVLYGSKVEEGKLGHEYVAPANLGRMSNAQANSLSHEQDGLPVTQKRSKYAPESSTKVPSRLSRMASMPPSVSYRQGGTTYEKGQASQARQVAQNVEKFTLLERQNVSIRDVRTMAGDNGFKKAISPANSNCWLRSAWFTVLSQLTPDELMERIINQCGEEFRGDAELFATLVNSTQNDVSSIFTRPREQEPLIFQPSRLKLPTESEDTNSTEAERIMTRITSELFKRQGMEQDEIDRIVEGNEFGSDKHIAAIANSMNVKMMIFSEVTNEVTIIAPKDSSLEKNLGNALNPDNFVDNFAERLGSVKNILTSEFDGVPIIKHSGGHEQMTQGSHFDVIVPTKAASKILY